MTNRMVLTDGTIVSIPCDHVKAGKVPEKWNVPVVCSIAALLGGVACAGSMLLLYMCLCTSDTNFLVKNDGAQQVLHPTKVGS